MEPTECSETSAFNIQTPGKYPEENLPNSKSCLQHYFWWHTNKQGIVASTFTKPESMWLYLWGMLQDEVYNNNYHTHDKKKNKNSEYSACKLKETAASSYFKYNEWNPNITYDILK
jgi:hypothetical protein